MLKNILITTLIFSSYASGITLDNLIALAKKKNFIIQEQNRSIEKTLYDTKLSTVWENPVLGIGVNDIQLDDVSARDLEAMQTQYISYTQSIPTNGKLNLQKDISVYDTKITTLQRDDSILKLVSTVRNYAYKIATVEKKIAVLNNYMLNLTKQKEIANVLYDNGKINQGDVVKIELKFYKLVLKKSNFEYQKEKYYIALENLVYTKVDSIEELSLEYKEDIGIQYNDTHPFVASIKEQLNQEDKKIAYEQSKKIDDLKFSVSYNQREAFEDYLSFSISIPLAIQGRENLKVAKQKINKDQKLDTLEGIEQKFKTDIADLSKKAQNSQHNLNTITNNLLPLTEKLQELFELHSSTNMMGSLSMYDAVNEKYELELMKYDELEIYFETVSRLAYYDIKGQGI
jgi:outer membrane protein TolC